jgi:hypothetical protein
MVRNNLPARLKRPNLNRAEYAALKSVLSLEVGYNNADKNYGPTIYSRELAKEQQGTLALGIWFAAQFYEMHKKRSKEAGCVLSTLFGNCTKHLVPMVYVADP